MAGRHGVPLDIANELSENSQEEVAGGVTSLKSFKIGPPIFAKLLAFLKIFETPCNSPR